MNGDSENGFMANQRTPEEKEMDDAVDESDYDNEDDDDDDDDDKNDFLTQRMPDQHPAVRTTLQLMGTLPSFLYMTNSIVSFANLSNRAHGWGSPILRSQPSLST